ncbi:hypothetical protein Tco_0519867 [Tanacetum coccineum]
MERSAGAKTNQTQKDRNPAQAGFRVIPDYKALAISRVGHGYHRKDLSQILKRSYFYPSIVATAQPSPPSALDIAYAVHVVSQFVSASTGPRRGVRRHSLGNSAEDHTGHRFGMEYGDLMRGGEMQSWYTRFRCNPYTCELVLISCGEGKCNPGTRGSVAIPILVSLCLLAAGRGNAILVHAVPLQSLYL